MKKRSTKKNNSCRYALLGFLFNEPSSGYEIGQIMEQSTNHFWQESDASIYPMLKKLEDEKKVTSRTERTGKRERTIFTITASGKKEFEEWMAQPVKIERSRSELLLKIFFGATAPKEELIKLLHTHHKKLEDQLLAFQKIEHDIFPNIPDSHPHKLFWKMTLRNGILSARADLKWNNECLEILEKK